MLSEIYFRLVTTRRVRNGKEENKSTKFQKYVSSIVLLHVVTSRYLYKYISITRNASICCILIIFYSPSGKSTSRIMKNLSVTNNGMHFFVAHLSRKASPQSFQHITAQIYFYFPGHAIEIIAKELGRLEMRACNSA